MLALAPIRGPQAACPPAGPNAAAVQRVSATLARRPGGQRRWAAARARPEAGADSTSGSVSSLDLEPSEALAAGGSPTALLSLASEVSEATEAQAQAPQGSAAAAAAPQQQQLPPPTDHFRAAGQRLRSLLSGVGDGEEELLNNMLEEQPAWQKLGLCALAAAAISGGAALVCWLCGLDPLGGSSLSLATARAAAVGGAAAAPLVAVKALLWSEGARRELPFLEDVLKAQVESFRPMVSGLSPVQTAALLATEVVPGVLILLPACAGGVARAVEMYASLAGAELPDALSLAAGLGVTTVIVGISKVAETSVTMEEYEVVRDALDNADRFYRVMATGAHTGPLEAQRAADAFRSVALTWMARNQVATRFAGLLGGAEVLYLGVLWHLTGDLAAPMVAAIGASAVDFAQIRRQLAMPAKRDA